MDLVQILLTTYNGEKKYLPELLKSLESQEYSAIKLLIRDDGSTDGTPDILHSFKEKSKIETEIISENNIGVIQSFFKLLKSSDPSASYFAFCDQDDIWLKNKIATAVEKIAEVSLNTKRQIPVMYCSIQTLTDENLNVVKNTSYPKKGLSFKNAVVENVATGCTIVINKALRDILSKQIPLYSLMHDGWIYMTASAFGKIIFDKNSYIYYRQHSSNIIGVKNNLRQIYFAKAKRFLVAMKGKNGIYDQAQEFYEIFGKELSADHKKILEEFLYSRSNFGNRLKYLFTCPLYKQSALDTIMLKILIFFNKI